MNTTKMSFWYSQKHAEHYASILPGDVNDRIRKNMVILSDGEEHVYVACHRDVNAKEPWTGALERFPDYEMIGVATIRDIRHRGFWN